MAVINRIDAKDTYKVWPFKPRFEDGYNNIGAIDLTLEPHRIDEIYEISNLKRTKEALRSINAENTAVMTLGIDCGPLDELYCGYVEFCFRPHINLSSIDLDLLDERLIAHVAKNKGIEGESYIKSVLTWEYHEATIHGDGPLRVYSVWFRERSEEDADFLLAFLLGWLHSEFLHLAS